uniref:Fatty acid hydroxylase n=1 Tax=Helianthus annuus TaxID=4232 RepID=A0A251U5E8_HELAN
MVVRITMTITIMSEAKAKATLHPSSLTVTTYMEQTRYDFPWTLTKYIPFNGGPDYHDYHHYVGGQSQSYFASVFTYCDYIYGTDKVGKPY